MDKPSHAPRSLVVRFVDGILYDQAKQFLEGLGLIVRDKGLSWENRHVLMVVTPDDDLNKWITTLYTTSMIRLVEQERFSYPAVT